MPPTLSKSAFALALAASFLAAPTPSAAADRPKASLEGVFALKGGRVVTVTGNVIESGLVVVRDGIIESVGPATGSVPFDAEIVDTTGLVVYPGFVDAGTTTGIDAELERKRKENATGGTADAATDVLPEMTPDNRNLVHSDVEAIELLKIEASTFAPSREAGFVAGEVAPARGAIRGWGAVLSFSDSPLPAPLRTPAALHAAFEFGGRGPGGGGGYPSTLFGVIAHLRQSFLDAERLDSELADYARRGMKGRRRPAGDEPLKRLGDVIRRDAPVVFEASTHEAIHRALKLADEVGFDVRIAGAAESFKIAPRLRSAGIPVILDLAVRDEPKKKDAAKSGEGEGPDAAPGHGFHGDDGCLAELASGAALLAEEEDERPPERPAGRRRFRPGPDEPSGEGAGESPDSPKKPDPPKPEMPWDAAEKAREAVRTDAIFAEEHAEWAESVGGPAVLAASGVRFAFRTGSSGDKKKAVAAARTFVEHGLPRDVALRALTIEPARLLGVDPQLGSIEPGKIASLAVFTGDVFDKESQARFVFVEGKKFEFEQKKKPEPGGGRRGGGGSGGGGSGGAPDARVAGTWEATSKSSMGQFEFTLELEQDGTSLGGKLVSKQFGREFPLAGTISGDALEATVRMEFGGNSAEIRISATVSGRSMSGTSTSAFSEEEAEFEAKKASGPEERS